MALFGVGVIFGPIVGPTLGGWITDSVGWRWVFYINAPLGLLGILLGYLFITDPAYLKRPEGRIDFSSFIYIALGLGFLEILLNRGERYRLVSQPAHPDLCTAFRSRPRPFRLAIVHHERPLVTSPCSAAGSSPPALCSCPARLQISTVRSRAQPPSSREALGLPPTWAGLMLSAGGLMSHLSMAIVGPLVGRVDTRLLLVAESS